LADAAPRIALLDDSVVAGIAAGEVVERPASVVKELVENSIDAGARRIRIDYDDKPALRILVADDGCGIEEEQIELALRRHATSKIRTLEELEAVATFGFRGEALASIASASDVEIVTSTRGANSAVRVLASGGRIIERSAAAARPGTSIEVRDLFASVPARRKFLKSPAAEAAMVGDVVRRFALASPAVHFTLVVSGRIVLDAAPVADGAARMRQVLGRDVAASLLEVDARYGSLQLTGYVSAPGEAHGSSRRMALFVGRRWVRDRLLYRAVLEGYQTHLLRGRFPAVALFLDCQPGSVDVNVHPAKLEVRFAEPDAVHRFVAEAVRDTLRRSASPLGRWGLSAEEALRRRAVPQQRTWQREQGGGSASGSAAYQRHAGPAGTLVQPGASASRDETTAAAAMPADATPVPEAVYETAIPGYVSAAPSMPPAPTPQDQVSLDLGSDTSDEALGRFQIIGQVLDGYLVCQGGGEVVLVDQHAAHERALFERLMQAFGERQVARQPLLLPVTVRVGAAAVQDLQRERDSLLALGWEIDEFGDDEVLVRALPAVAAGIAVEPLVEALAADLARSRGIASAERVAEKVMASVACHSAVRVGKHLDLAAARALLREMATVSYHSTCPHGRPVARTLTRAQIERMFGR